MKVVGWVPEQALKSYHLHCQVAKPFWTWALCSCNACCLEGEGWMLTALVEATLVEEAVPLAPGKFKPCLKALSICPNWFISMLPKSSPCMWLPWGLSKALLLLTGTCLADSFGADQLVCGDLKGMCLAMALSCSNCFGTGLSCHRQHCRALLGAFQETQGNP